MALILDGDGTISGLNVGGLPDGSVNADDLASNAVTEAKIASNAVTTAKILDANITAAKLDGAQSGSAPIYAARAWVNFNGTGTVAIRASGNVSSITDNNVGNYTVNFTTAMPDADYSVVLSIGSDSLQIPITSTGTSGAGRTPNYLTSSVRIVTYNQTGSTSDHIYNCVSIFR
jgi:hypothetical protein